MGSKGGSQPQQPSGFTTTTQTSQPWSEQAPFLKQAMQQASNLFTGYTPQYFPQSTVAPQNQTQMLGQGLGTAYGLMGDPSVNAASGSLAFNNAGGFLDPNNPFLNATQQQVLTGVLPQIAGAQNLSGRYGSQGGDFAAAQGAASALAPFSFNALQQAQDNLLKGAAIAPTIDQARQSQLGLINQSGAAQQQQTQAQINDAVNRFNFQQNLPYQQLSQFEQGIQGNYGGTSALSQPYYIGGKGGASGTPSGGKGGKSGGSTASTLASVAKLAALAL